MIATILTISLIIIATVNIFMEMKRDLMMLQQNSYRNERYRRWLSTSGDTTSWVRLFALIAVMVMALQRIPETFRCMVIMIPLLINIFSLMAAKYKKPLVWTNRAKRIYVTAMVLCVLVVAIGWLVCYERDLYVIAFLTALLYVCSHIVIMAANILLKPVEKHINAGYYNDAARILKSMNDLMVIGVTGSYGKTSTKHYLHRILSEKYNVLMTPGSYNTTLGVIRTVREMMKPYTEVFICEMGAKNIGDIKEICDLVHPRIGIVTAVGEQHLESFKTIENVQRTKFELVDSLPADGMAFVNDDFPYVANREVTNVPVVRYALTDKGNNAYYVENLVYSAAGTDFTLVSPSGKHDFHTKLVGEFNISNLIGAIAVAIYMDVPMERIRNAVAKIEQVEHRLSVKHVPGGITIIDDAFNSNPDGSRMALDVLASMKDGKRIVITPGMIELGDKQYEYNEAFGRKIAASVDIAVIVGEYNRDAILSGLRDAGMDETKVYAVDTFNDAQAVLSRVSAPGDAVLYENDLPDTFK